MGAVVKGWCPDAYRPMRAGDGLILRIKPWKSQLSQAELTEMAAFVEAFGYGYVNLTSRANLQIRGLSEEDYRHGLERLQSAGLISDEDVEPRRNILFSPFGDDEAARLYEALAARLGEFPTLPSKFGFAIDCGSRRYLSDASADIRFERGADGALMVRADGAKQGFAVDFHEAVDTALALARWFVENGGVRDGRGRMRALAQNLPEAYAHAKPAPAQPQPSLDAHHIAPVFGEIKASELRQLAKVAPLRLTPWRSVLTEKPIDLGWITSDHDPRRGIVLCAGAPYCLQAMQDTRSLAHLILDELTTAQDIHISGCEKRCASQANHEWALIGCASHYALCKNGAEVAKLSRIEIEEMIKEHHALFL